MSEESFSRRPGLTGNPTSLSGASRPLPLPEEGRPAQPSLVDRIHRANVQPRSRNEEDQRFAREFVGLEPDEAPPPHLAQQLNVPQALALSGDLVDPCSGQKEDSVNPVEETGDAGPTKLVTGINCKCPCKDNCLLSHCREWQCQEEMKFVPSLLPGWTTKYPSASTCCFPEN